MKIWVLYIQQGETTGVLGAIKSLDNAVDFVKNHTYLDSEESKELIRNKVITIQTNKTYRLTQVDLNFA